MSPVAPPSVTEPFLQSADKGPGSFSDRGHGNDVQFRGHRNVCVYTHTQIYFLKIRNVLLHSMNVSALIYSSGFNESPKEKMYTIMEEEKDTGGPSKG